MGAGGGGGGKGIPKLGITKGWRDRQIDLRKALGKTRRVYQILPLPLPLSLKWWENCELPCSDTYRAASSSMPQKISLGKYFILLKEISLKMINFKIVKALFSRVGQVEVAKYFSFKFCGCHYFEVYSVSRNSRRYWVLRSYFFLKFRCFRLPLPF